MRGALFIVIIIALLIVGVLVMKNIQTAPQGGSTQKEAIERAEKAAETAEKAIDKMNKDSNRAMDY